MSTMGRTGGGLRWRPRFRLPRPIGVRNGGLLLVLVALAAVMALVHEPPEPGLGRRLPGIFQSLPPPVGIAQLPPTVAEPPAASGVDGAGWPPSAGRAHPRRAHPRPARSRATGSLKGDVVTRGRGGSGSTPPGTSPPVAQPPVAAPPVAVTPAARVRVAPVEVRVTPPAVLGRDLPEVRVATPEVAAGLPVRLTATP